MKKKSFKYVIIMMLAIGMQIFLAHPTCPTSAVNLEGYKVVMLLANGSGEYDVNSMKASFTHSNATVTLAGLTETVTVSDGREIDVDVLISDITDIATYDVVFIPSGNGVDQLKADNSTKELIVAADAAEVMLTAVGPASLVLAEAGILVGRHIAGGTNYGDDLEALGAIPTYSWLPCTDDHIVTVGYTQGNPQAIYHLFYAISFNLGEHCNFSLACITSLSTINKDEYNVNFQLELEDFSVIDQVLVNVSDNTELIATVNMTKLSLNTWNGSTMVEQGEYSIDISFVTNWGHTDQLLDVHTMTVPEESGTAAPSFTFLFTLISLVGVASILRPQKK